MPPRPVPASPSAARRRVGRRAARVVALALLVAACRSRGAFPPQLEPYVLTGTELARTGEATLYDAIRVLRPNWLRRPYGSAATTGDANVVVYVDGQRSGGVSVLRGMNPGAPVRVRYYGPSEAQARFGGGALDGAIEVVTIDQSSG